jgi:hypothetical protein
MSEAEIDGAKRAFEALETGRDPDADPGSEILLEWLDARIRGRSET